MFKDLKRASIIALLLLIAGCNTPSSNQQWPADLPEKRIFVDEYLSNRHLETDDPKLIDTHLTWVIRFYQGTVLYPNGWNRVSERFLSSIDDKHDREKMVSRVRSLGILIANEWAQDNDVRKINSANVAVWGSALRTSAQRNDQEDYIFKVEQDVKSLISGSLKASEINYERYYPPEDYDNF